MRKGKKLGYGIIWTIVSIVLALGIPMIFTEVGYHSIGFGIAALGIVHLAYRYGFSLSLIWGIVFGLSVGVGYAVLWKQDLSLSTLVYTAIGAVIAMTGLFARNIHKTLNNKRFSSFTLNVVTSHGIVGLVQLVVYYTMDWIGLISIALFVIAGSVLHMIIGKVQPKLILTKRSAFLTSKERSRLLND